MNIIIALVITACTGIILLLACFRVSTELKLLMMILTAGIFVYSGIGIAYDTVRNSYIVHFIIFLSVLLFTIKVICSNKVKFTFGHNATFIENKVSLTDEIDNTLGGMDKIIILFTGIFFFTYLFNIVYPTNRMSSLFNISNFISYSIHARRIEHNSYTLLKIADALGIATLPFFFVYLYECAINTFWVKFKGFVLILLWILLAFGKYNYLSRYELVIYFGFIVMYFLVCKYTSIKIDKKTVFIIMITAFLLVPFLVNFTDIRLGRASSDLSFIDAFNKLIKDECFYPEYYDTCIEHAGLVNPVNFILWIICLPIPSVIWPGKPIVQIAYAFTGLFTSNTVTSANYSNLLPSVLGESFLIFGPYFFWIEAVILGLVIGLYFRFFLHSKKLSMLTAYMILMLATIGRGGAQSYVSVIINGSIVLVIMLLVARKIRIKIC